MTTKNTSILHKGSHSRVLKLGFGVVFGLEEPSALHQLVQLEPGEFRQREAVDFFTSSSEQSQLWGCALNVFEFHVGVLRNVLVNESLHFGETVQRTTATALKFEKC